jgi:hypothetical protein
VSPVGDRLSRSSVTYPLPEGSLWQGPRAPLVDCETGTRSLPRTRYSIIMRTPLLLIATALVATACPFEVTGPETDLEGLPDGLEVTLDVEPEGVTQHALFSATLRVRNTTLEPISITTASTCLALPHVLRNGRRMPFEGTTVGCGDAISNFVVPAGEALTVTWPLRAELYAEAPGDVDGAPAPRGTYWVQARFEVYSPGGTHQPSVAAMLRVW